MARICKRLGIRAARASVTPVCSMLRTQTTLSAPTHAHTAAHRERVEKPVFKQAARAERSRWLKMDMDVATAWVSGLWTMRALWTKQHFSLSVSINRCFGERGVMGSAEWALTHLSIKLITAPRAVYPGELSGWLIPHSAITHVTETGGKISPGLTYSCSAHKRFFFFYSCCWEVGQALQNTETLIYKYRSGNFVFPQNQCLKRCIFCVECCFMMPLFYCLDYGIGESCKSLFTHMQNVFIHTLLTLIVHILNHVL